MSIVVRYLAYAEAFEKSYVDDDWTHIEPYFTEDAVYEVAPDDEARGRAVVMAKLKYAVDTFDRRMDSRMLDFQTPTVDGNTISVNWKVTYAKAECPDLVLSGLETAVFDGDRIELLRDGFDPAAIQAMGDWMAANGAVLQD